jgi:cholesterol oxidase
LLEAVRGAQRLPEPWRSLVRVKRLAARARVSDRSIAHVEASGVATAGPGYDDALFMLLVGRDRAPGRMRVLRPFGTFDVSFSRRDEQPLFDRMATAISDLAGAVGGTGALSADIGPLGLFLTAHPLGGCPMSHDRDDGLRVLDGSIVPAALGSNPSLTIAALAERGVEQLIASGEPQ